MDWHPSGSRGSVGCANQPRVAAWADPDERITAESPGSRAVGGDRTDGFNRRDRGQGTDDGDGPTRPAADSGPAGTTSIRLGYGMYFTAYEGLSAGIMSANPPYGYTYTSAAPPLFALGPPSRRLRRR